MNANPTELVNPVVEAMMPLEHSPEPPAGFVTATRPTTGPVEALT